MSNNIQQLVLHKLIKDQHGTPSLELSETLTDITSSAQRLIDHLHKLYTERTGKAYGQFEDDENNFPTQRFIRDHFTNNTIDFYKLSTVMMEHLQYRAGEEQLATGGYVLISHVINGDNSFLLVAIVTEVVGTAITQGLEIIDSIHLDMNNLRVAGRVNLTTWQSGAERYVSFLKGRGEVANYFKKFLGCSDVLIALRETQKLVLGLNSFAENNNLDTSDRDRFFEDAYSYLQDLGRDGNTINIDTFANRLWPDDPEQLRTALASDDLQLSDGFIPDRRAIKVLMKFKGNTEHWKLEFDRAALRNGDVNYDSSNNRITLSNVPQALAKRVLEEIAEAQQDDAVQTEKPMENVTA